MQVIIEIDERKAISSEVEDLLHELEPIVRKWEAIADIRIAREPLKL